LVDVWAVTFDFGTARRGLGGAVATDNHQRPVWSITVKLLYNGPLLRGFNMPIKGVTLQIVHASVTSMYVVCYDIL